jgi:26S proteasome regulatory subunit N8
MSSSPEVVVHPLVLLSVVDHYNRVAKDTKKRVVGVLLGNRSRTKVDITNSFAVPFEEDLNNPTVWFLDHDFLDTMYWNFKKVNSKLIILCFYIIEMFSFFLANENIVGFYSSGPRIKENDLKVCKKFFL